LKLRRIGALAGAGAGIAMLVASVPAASAATAVTQPYTCNAGGATVQASATVTGKAAENSTSTAIKLTNVVFKVTNTFGVGTVTVNHIKVSVPDPNTTSAPYVANSVAVAASPAGWTAGHDATGAFASFAGSKTVPTNGTVANAALKAKYKDKGPVGTVINYVPGQISFNITSPITATATCTATAPMTFATVTE
jgi:hypothetical protein